MSGLSLPALLATTGIVCISEGVCGKQELRIYSKYGLPPPSAKSFEETIERPGSAVSKLLVSHPLFI
jgi:hypothetical protein